MSPDDETNHQPSESTNSDLIGDETFALHNPLKATQPLRQQTYSQKSDTEKLVLAQRQAKRKQVALALDSEIQEYHRESKTRIRELAQQYSKKESEIRDRLYHVPTFKQERKINMFNAEVIAKSKELHTLQPDKTFSLREVQKIVLQDREERESRGEVIPQEERRKILQLAKEKRQLKTQGARTTNRSATHDVYITGAHITMELKRLQERSGAAGVVAIAGGHMNDIFAPTVYETQNASGFCHQSLGFNPADIGGRLECWASTGKQGHQSLQNTKALRKECVAAILKSLREITGRDDIVMNYNNYDTAIVARYRVQLFGWPRDIPFLNPSNINTVDQLRWLRDALDTGKCYWVVMSRAQVEEHSAELDNMRAEGRTIGVPRKEQCDKNRRWARRDDPDNVARLSPMKKRKQMHQSSKAASQMPPCHTSPISSEFIDPDLNLEVEQVDASASLPTIEQANVAHTTGLADTLNAVPTIGHPKFIHPDLDFRIDQVNMSAIEGDDTVIDPNLDLRIEQVDASGIEGAGVLSPAPNTPSSTSAAEQVNTPASAPSPEQANAPSSCPSLEQANASSTPTIGHVDVNDIPAHALENNIPNLNQADAAPGTIVNAPLTIKINLGLRRGHKKATAKSVGRAESVAVPTVDPNARRSSRLNG